MGLARRKGALLRDPPHLFAARVAELAPEVDVRVLRPGESLEMPAAVPGGSPDSGDARPSAPT
jgi:hypothetical protein